MLLSICPSFLAWSDTGTGTFAADGEKASAGVKSMAASAKFCLLRIILLVRVLICGCETKGRF